MLRVLPHAQLQATHSLYAPQIGQCWHRNSWDRGWHPHAGGSGRSWLLGPYGCSKGHRQVKVSVCRLCETRSRGQRLGWPSADPEQEATLSVGTDNRLSEPWTIAAAPPLRLGPGRPDPEWTFVCSGGLSSIGILSDVGDRRHAFTSGCLSGFSTRKKRITLSEPMISGALPLRFESCLV